MSMSYQIRKAEWWAEIKKSNLHLTACRGDWVGRDPREPSGDCLVEAGVPGARVALTVSYLGARWPRNAWSKICIPPPPGVRQLV